MHILNRHLLQCACPQVSIQSALTIVYPATKLGQRQTELKQGWAVYRYIAVLRYCIDTVPVYICMFITPKTGYRLYRKIAFSISNIWSCNSQVRSYLSFQASLSVLNISVNTFLCWVDGEMLTKTIINRMNRSLQGVILFCRLQLLLHWS